MTADSFRKLLKPLATRIPAARSEDLDALLESRAMKSIELRERTEKDVMDYLEGLREAIPGLFITHHLYGGDYVVGARSLVPHGDWHGRPIMCLNRIDFAIHVDLDDEELRIICRSTVLNRDFDALRFVAPIDADDKQALEDFVEQCCLHFAGRYFERVKTDQQVRVVA